MLKLIETNIRSSMRDLEVPEEKPAPQPEATVLRHSDVSVDELPEGKVADAQDLLESALKSNMETARLYSELKQVKDSLEKKNEEVTQLYTQLERANQDNLKTRRYLEGLIQSVGEAIISFSHDGRILTWNAAAEQIFGYARSEIVGHSFLQLCPPSRAGELDQVVTQVGKGQIIRDVLTSRLRKDQTEFPATVTYAPIRGGDERVLAFSALTRDVSGQKELEQRVESLESGAFLSRLMPPMFNELANRLSPILIQKGLLIEEAGDPRTVSRFTKLFQAVDSAQNLLRPLLMIISPSSPRRERVQLNRLLQEAVKRVEAEAAAAGVTVDFASSPELPECALDVEQVRECLVDLIRSGVYVSAHASARRVRVGSRALGAVVQVVVQDSGMALPEPEKGKVFELANVSDATTLGWCVAASVVRGHEGRISVRSQEGIGNAFLLEFPMMEGAMTPTIPPALDGKKVLVVDDESFLLECLVDAITAWGCEVTPCGLAAEAIQKLQLDSYDIIVSDIRMPGLSGIQLYGWIQENQPAMTRKILYTTGDSFDPETREFLDRSHLPSLGKPFDLKKLKLALGDLLASAGPLTGRIRQEALMRNLVPWRRWRRDRFLSPAGHGAGEAAGGLRPLPGQPRDAGGERPRLRLRSGLRGLPAAHPQPTSTTAAGSPSW